MNVISNDSDGDVLPDGGTYNNNSNLNVRLYNDDVIESNIIENGIRYDNTIGRNDDNDEVRDRILESSINNIDHNNYATDQQPQLEHQPYQVHNAPYNEEEEEEEEEDSTVANNNNKNNIYNDTGEIWQQPQSRTALYHNDYDVYEFHYDTDHDIYEEQHPENVSRLQPDSVHDIFDDTSVLSTTLHTYFDYDDDRFEYFNVISDPYLEHPGNAAFLAHVTRNLSRYSIQPNEFNISKGDVTIQRTKTGTRTTSIMDCCSILIQYLLLLLMIQILTKRLLSSSIKVMIQHKRFLRMPMLLQRQKESRQQKKATNTGAYELL
jgi:hypothetical protein